MRRMMSRVKMTAIALGALTAFAGFAISQDAAAPKNTVALPDKYMYSLHQQGNARSITII